MGNRVIEENLKNVTEEEFKEYLGRFEDPALEHFVIEGICQALPPSSEYSLNPKCNIKGMYWHSHFKKKIKREDYEKIILDEVYSYKSECDDVLKNFTIHILSTTDLAAKYKKCDFNPKKDLEEFSEEELEEAFYKVLDGRCYSFYCRLFGITPKEERLEKVSKVIEQDEELHQRQNEVNKLIEEAAKAIETAESEVKERDKKIKSLEKENRILSEKINQTKGTNEKLSEKSTKLNQEILSLKEALANSKKEIESLKTKACKDVKEENRIDFNNKLASIIKRIDVTNELAYFTDTMSNANTEDIKNFLRANVTNLTKEINDNNIDAVKRNLLVSYVLASVIGDEL